jgi:hypothetical protein
VLSLVFLLAHAAVVSGLISSLAMRGSMTVSVAGAAVIGGICVFSAAYRFGRIGSAHVTAGVVISYLYFAGRAMSLASVLIAKVGRIQR